ncbi:MAG: HIT domain-containing protein [Anaerolineae bacterium]|nr:HIT domain-containing protein [Anaerolineae bacterium]
MDHLWTPWRMRYLQKGAGREMSDFCVFCHKARARDDASEHILARSEHVYVTLNLYPYNNGHLMVIPYIHVASSERLPAEALLDLMATANRAMAVLRDAYNPQAFNIGANIGAAAGAGIAEHFHLHVVPRWGGDTNYMTVIAETRVIPDWIDDTYQQLREIWERRFPPGG